MLLSSTKRTPLVLLSLLALLLVDLNNFFFDGTYLSSSSPSPSFYAVAQEGEGSYYEIVAYASNDCVTGALIDDTDVYLGVFESINPEYETELSAAPPPTTTATSCKKESSKSSRSRLGRERALLRQQSSFDRTSSQRQQQWHRRQRRGQCPSQCKYRIV